MLRVLLEPVWFLGGKSHERLPRARRCYRAFVAVRASVLVDLQEQRTVAFLASFNADAASGAFFGVDSVFVAVFDHVLADKGVGWA